MYYVDNMENNNDPQNDYGEQFLHYVVNKCALRIGETILMHVTEPDDEDIFVNNLIAIGEEVGAFLTADQPDHMRLSSGSEDERSTPFSYIVKYATDKTRIAIEEMKENVGENALKSWLFDRYLEVEDYEAKIPELIEQRNRLAQVSFTGISNEGPLEPSQNTRPPLRVV